MSDFVIPEWMETAADREARLERERQAEQRLIQAKRQAHLEAIQLCGELVLELFVDKVDQIVYFKGMAVRSRKAAIGFAERAVKHMYKGGVSINSKQDTKGGIMLHRWDPLEIPKPEEMEKLELEHKVHGTWIDRTRKAVKIKYESGQTKIVKQPRIVQEIVTYAGKGVGKGPREIDGLGPSWDQLYVGQRVTLTKEAVQRREKYRLGDQAGVSERRAKGDTIFKALLECTGIIINAVEDTQLQTDITYAPGKKTTNYTCYPGGGSWVRWDATKEVTFVWTNRLTPTEHGNSIDEIEHRTDLIDAQEWDKLDAETQKSHTALAQLPEKFVLILRDKAMQARIRAHHAKINRFSKEAVAERLKTPGGGIEQMMAKLKARQAGGK